MKARIEKPAKSINLDSDSWLLNSYNYLQNTTHSVMISHLQQNTPSRKIEITSYTGPEETIEARIEKMTISITT